MSTRAGTSYGRGQAPGAGPGPAPGRGRGRGGGPETWTPSLPFTAALPVTTTGAVGPSGAQEGACQARCIAESEPLLILSEHNYDQWLRSVKLRFTLCMLEGLLPDTLDHDIASDHMLQQYGLALLLPTLTPKDQQHVFSSSTVAEAIAAVHTARHGTRRIQQVNLLVDLFNMQMESADNIADFVQRVETLTRELADAGIQLDPLIPPIKVITAASRLDKYRSTANIVLGSDQTLTMPAVHQALRAVEVTAKDSALPTGSAFAASGHATAAQTGTSAQQSANPDMPADPITAVAALANHCSALSPSWALASSLPANPAAATSSIAATQSSSMPGRAVSSMQVRSAHTTTMPSARSHPYQPQQGNFRRNGGQRQFNQQGQGQGQRPLSPA